MKTCTITFKDNMNAVIRGLDNKTAYACEDKLAFLVPHRFHMAAFKLGRWDGKTKFFKKESGRTYISMLEDVVPIITSNGYHIEFEDLRETVAGSPMTPTTDMFSEFVWPDDHFLAGQPVMLRDDQVESANIYLDHRYGMMCLPTSYGKTLLSACISKCVESMGRTIIIVPSKSLVEQTRETMQMVGMDVGGIHGELREIGHQHTVTTWQSLMSIFKSKDAELIYDIVRDIVLVNVDECHQVRDASELKNILGDFFHHVPYRLGLTGTVPKEDYHSKSIVASLGRLIHFVPLKLMQELGFIARCEVHNIVTHENYKFNDYAAEAAHLSRDQDRLQFIAEGVEYIRETGNTLILVNSVAAGKELAALIPDSVFVYGKTKQRDRSAAYKGVNTQENTVIIATYQVAAVGISIPRIFNLITVEAGKSFVRVVQSIGRAIRIAKDKDFARVFDVSSSCKYSSKHLKERIPFYQEMEYPFQRNEGSYDECIAHIERILISPPLEDNA